MISVSETLLEIMNQICRAMSDPVILMGDNVEFEGKEFVIVEDDASFRAYLENFLKKHNCKVRSFDRADTAIREIRERSWNWSPFMVIADIVLGASSGYVFIRQVADIYSRKPVAILAISQLVGSDDQAEAELAGASRYLRKPIKNEAVLEAAIKETAEKVYEPNKNTLTLRSS